jgi:hypothetical protein
MMLSVSARQTLTLEKSDYPGEFLAFTNLNPCQLLAYKKFEHKSVSTNNRHKMADKN